MKADVESVERISASTCWSAELQKHYGQAPQCVLTMPLLEGLDGVKRCPSRWATTSVSTSPQRDLSGRSCRSPDDLMWRYYDLLSFLPATEIKALRHRSPRAESADDIKVKLAQELVARFHGVAAAACGARISNRASSGMRFRRDWRFR